jgi:hypothetical protein
MRRTWPWELAGFGSPTPPYALAEKDASAGRQLAWQYLFPARQLSREPRPLEADADSRLDVKQLRRHHVTPASSATRMSAAMQLHAVR